MKKRLVSIILICVFGLSVPGCSFPSYMISDSGAYDKGVAALSEGRYDDAEKYFAEAVETDGRDEEGYRGQGLVYYEQEEYEVAALYFKKSLESMRYENDAFFEDVNFYRAQCLEKTGKDEEAAEIYRSLTGGDKGGLAYAYLGSILMREGNAEEAEEAFKEAVLHEKNYNIYILIYEAYAAARREAEGAPYLEMALEIEPESADDHARVGLIYYYLENHTMARTSLDKAIQEGCIEALPLLGKICLEDGDVSGAKDLYTNALEKGLDRAESCNGLALCEARSGNYKTALDYINEGLEYANESSRRSLLFNRITVYEDMRDFQSAKEYIEEFLELYPDDEAAKREYKYLSHVQ